MHLPLLLSTSRLLRPQHRSGRWPLPEGYPPSVDHGKAVERRANLPPARRSLWPIQSAEGARLFACIRFPNTVDAAISFL